MGLADRDYTKRDSNGNINYGRTAKKVTSKSSLDVRF